MLIRQPQFDLSVLRQGGGMHLEKIIANKISLIIADYSALDACYTGPSFL